MGSLSIRLLYGGVGGGLMVIGQEYIKRRHIFIYTYIDYTNYATT